MSFYDGEVEVRHFFHIDSASAPPMPPQTGQVVIHTWVVNNNFTVPRIIPGTNPPAQQWVNVVEFHHLVTNNPAYL